MIGPDLDLSLTTGRNESAIQFRGCFKSTLSYIFLAILIIFKETKFFLLMDVLQKFAFVSIDSSFERQLWKFLLSKY